MFYIAYVNKLQLVLGLLIYSQILYDTAGNTFWDGTLQHEHEAVAYREGTRRADGVTSTTSLQQAGQCQEVT